MTLGATSRRRRTLKPAVHNRRIPHKSNTNVVPIVLLAPELERIVTKIQDELRDRSNGEDENGAVGVLANRIAAENGTTPERYARRIYEWRQYRTWSVPASTVDLIYQAVGETYTDQKNPLAELPSGMEAAKEMVDVWCEDWTDEEKESLAVTLLHFSEGFCLGFDVIDLEVCNGLEAFFRGQYR